MAPKKQKKSRGVFASMGTPPPALGRPGHPQYYKLKSADTEFERDRDRLIPQVQADAQRWFEHELRARLAPLIEKRRQIFAEAGLDTAKRYGFIDATETITEES